MSATSGYNAPEKAGKILVIAALAGATAYAGSLMAINGTGNAVLAANTSGLRVAGRLERDIVNGVNYLGKPDAEIKRGCFGYKNSATAPLTVADVGTMALVEDSETVTKTASNNIKAGIFLGFDPDGLAIIDTRPAILG